MKRLLSRWAWLAIGSVLFGHQPVFAQSAPRDTRDLVKRVAERVLPELNAMGLVPPKGKEAFQFVVGEGGYVQAAVDPYSRQFLFGGDEFGIRQQLPKFAERGAPPNIRIEQVGTEERTVGRSSYTLSIARGRFSEDTVIFSLPARPESQIRAAGGGRIGSVPGRGQARVSNPEVSHTETHTLTEAVFFGLKGKIKVVTKVGQTNRTVGILGQGNLTEPVPLHYERASAYFTHEIAGAPPIWVTFRSGDGDLLAPRLDRAGVERVMNACARALLAELGSGAPAPSPVPPAPIGPIVPAIPPAPVARSESAPPPPPNDAAARIAAMDRALAGLEDELQARLIALQLLTKTLDERRAEIARLQELLAGQTDPALRGKISARIRAQQVELGEFSQLRQQFAAEARALMDKAVAEVERIYAPGRFGKLDFSALLRVDAAKARREFLHAQIELVQKNFAAARAQAERMRGIATLAGASFYIEGMAYLLEGRMVEGMEAFRTAKRRGLKDSPGGAFDVLAREPEIVVLRALQASALNESARFRDEFEDWIGVKAKVSRKGDEFEYSGWLAIVARTGLSDIITNFAGDEAERRGLEVGSATMDLSRSHVGLGILIGLRRDHALPELRDMTIEEFGRAARARWSREFTAEHLQAMRNAMHHAFKLPDVRKLADGGVILTGDLLSRPLLDRIEFERAWWSGYPAAAAQWVGNLITVENLAISLAPSAKIGAGIIPRLMSSAEAAALPTLGAWFGSSRPVAAAGKLLAQYPAGRKAIEGMARVHAWSQQGLPQAGALLLSQMVVSGGASYLAREYLGEEAGILVDVLSAFGVDSPEFYHGLAKTVGLTASRAQDVAAGVRRLASAGARALARADDVALRLRGMSSSAPDPGRLTALRRELDGVPPEISSHLDRAATHMAAGETEAVEQALRDAQLARTDFARRVVAGDTLVQKLDEIAPKLPELPPASAVEIEAGTRIAPRPAPETTRTPENFSPRTVDADGARPVVREGAGTLRRPDADAPAIQRIDRGNPDTPPRLRVDEPASPVHQADVLLADRKFHEAALEYEKLKVELGPNSPLATEIEQKLRIALDGEGYARSKATRAGSAASTVRSREVFKNPELMKEVEEAVGLGTWPDDDTIRKIDALPTEKERREFFETLVQPDTPHLVPVNLFKGTSSTAAAPKFAYGKNRQRLAVIKEPIGQRLPHPDGIAETIATRVSELLGRSTTTARVKELNVRGQKVEKLIIELLPEGRELDDIAPGAARLLEHKKELTEDMVFSLLLGDGDRHFGNQWIGDDGKLTHIDYGLSDLFPEHPYRGRLYGERTLRIPQGPDDPAFRAYVESTMKGHLSWGTRRWDIDGGTFKSSLRIEDFLPHVENLRKKLLQRNPANPSQAVLDQIVEEILGVHPKKEFVRELLRQRLDAMEKVLRNQLPKLRSTVAMIPARPLLFVALEQEEWRLAA